METKLRTRSIAKKYSITSINNGSFIVSGNFEEPNYLQINNDRVFRVNILGTVVEKNDVNGREVLIIDDGSRISLRSFSDLNFNDNNIGDIVIVTGRPRKNNEGMFVAVETIMNVDPKWILTRKKEISFYEKYYSKNPDNPNPTVKIEENKTESNENMIEEEESLGFDNKDPKELYSSILKVIEELDKGEGANFIDVLNKIKESKFDLEKSELMINKMILDGEIFEIQGNLKISR